MAAEPSGTKRQKTNGGEEDVGHYFDAVGLPDTIPYEGPSSRNPLAFKYYDAEAMVHGRKMKEWLRFSVAYWHSFRGVGLDPFGGPTITRPWEDGSDSLENAKRRMRVNFEFLKRLGVEYYWCP